MNLLDQSNKSPAPRLFFREVRNGNLEKASVYLAQIIDAHLTRYPYNEDTMTIYITTHLMLILDLSGYLEIKASDPLEPIIQASVHQFAEYMDEPDATLRLSKDILKQVGTFNATNPFHSQDTENSMDLKDTAHSELIRNICAYLGQNFRDPNTTVTSTAEHFGLSVSYLSRLFHNATGMKMGDYILMLKFHEAKLLLRTTDLTISEIAKRCGFSGESAFIRSYRSKEGMTPGTYRHQLQFDSEGHLQSSKSERAEKKIESEKN